MKKLVFSAVLLGGLLANACVNLTGNYGGKGRISIQQKGCESISMRTFTVVGGLEIFSGQDQLMDGKIYEYQFEVEGIPYRTAFDPKAFNNRGSWRPSGDAIAMSSVQLTDKAIIHNHAVRDESGRKSKLSSIAYSLDAKGNLVRTDLINNKTLITPRD